MIASFFLNLSDTRHFLESYVESKTGRELHIKGDLSVNWALSPTFSAEQIDWINPDWAIEPIALSIENLRISLAFTDLIKGRVKITSVKIEKPKLWVEENPLNGRFNLELDSGNSTNKAEEIIPDWILVENLEIKNAQITLKQPERDWSFSIKQGNLRSADPFLPSLIDISGSVESTPIQFSGKVGALEDIIHFRESAIDLSGYLQVPMNKFTVSGVARDLARWQGLNLWIKAQLENLTDLQNIFNIKLPEFKNIRVNMELIQPGTVSTMRMEGVNIKSTDFGLNTEVRGEIGKVTKLNEIDLNFSSVGNLDISQFFNNIATDLPLQTHIEGKLSGSKDALEVNLAKAEIISEDISLQMASKIKISPDQISSLPVRVDAKSINSITNLFNKGAEKPIELGSPIQGFANFNFRDSAFHLDDIKVNTLNSDVLFAEGAITALGSEQKGKLDIRLDLSKHEITNLFEQGIVQNFEKIKANAQLQFDGDIISANQISVIATSKGIQANASGEIADLGVLENLAIPLEVKIDNLANLGLLINQEFPQTAEVKITGLLNSSLDQKLEINDISANLSDENLQVKITGKILDILQLPVMSLDVTSKLNTIQPISDVNEAFPILPIWEKILPIQLNAKVSSQTNDQQTIININNIDIRNADDTKITILSIGEIQHTFQSEPEPEGINNPLKGNLNLSMSGEIGSGDLSGLFGTDINSKIANGQWDGKLDLELSNNTVIFKNLVAKNKSNFTDLDVTAADIILSPFKVNDLSLRFDVAELDSLLLSEKFGLRGDHPANGLIKVDSEAADLQLNIDLKIADSDINGSIFIQSDAENSEIAKLPQITANLNSKRFDLVQLLTQPDESESIFSSEPLSMDWLNQWNGEINYAAGFFVDQSFRTKEMKANAILKNGVLNLEMRGKRGQGELISNIEVRSDSTELGVKLSLTGEKVNISAINKLYDSGEPTPGVFTIDMNIDGKGNSIAEIAASANGNATIEVSGAKVKNDGLQLIGGDLFMGLFSAVNPLQKQNKYLNLECGVIKLDIKQGRGSTPQGIAFKTDVVTLLGGGDVDFSDETLRFVVRPKARKGLGINTNSIAKMIRIGGTLTSPVVETDPKGLLQSGVAIGAAIASGGLSLLAQGLYDRTRANSDVCELALNGSKQVEVDDALLLN